MPRSNSRSKSPTLKSYSYSSPKTPSSQYSAPSNTIHAVNHTVEVERPGFFSNMWQGFGLGAGQAIAHNVFRNDPVVKHVHEKNSVIQSSSNLEKALPKEFVQCMKDNNNDKDLCKHYLDSSS
jgi:hypothetical protein